MFGLPLGGAIMQIGGITYMLKPLFFLIIGIISAIGFILFVITSGHQFDEDKWHNEFKDTLEVIAFYEKFDNVEISHMDLNTLFYSAIDGDTEWLLSINFGSSSPTPRMTLHCLHNEDTQNNYIVDENILNFIKNQNCF